MHLLNEWPECLKRAKNITFSNYIYQNAITTITLTPRENLAFQISSYPHANASKISERTKGKIPRISFICKWVMLQLPNKKYDMDYKVNFNFYLWKDGHFTETVRFLVFSWEQIVSSFYTLLNAYHLFGKRKKRHWCIMWSDIACRGINLPLTKSTTFIFVSSQWKWMIKVLQPNFHAFEEVILKKSSQLGQSKELLTCFHIFLSSKDNYNFHQSTSLMSDLSV